MGLIKKFFEHIGFRFGLQPGERYVCFEIPNMNEITDKNPEDWGWLDGSISNDIPVMPGRLNQPTQEFCVTITDPEFSVEEVVKTLESRGYVVKVKSIEEFKEHE